MTMTEFLATVFHGKEVDLYCGGNDWFYGRVQECVNGIVTLVAAEGTIHVAAERILSVSPKKV